MRNALRSILDNIRGLVSPVDAAQSSDDLLSRYRQDKDEAAFAAIMDRYGGLVYGTCRRVLRDHAGVEDAFQATFLVLAQKAADIREGQGLGGWLHRVALHVALKAKARCAKRLERENQAVRPDTNKESTRDVFQGTVVDEEVNHLPEKYRSAIVLCFLEGRSAEDAARDLGCPVGTIWGRVSRGKQMLRDRLVRRGVALGTLPTLLAADGLAQASVPPMLVRKTLQLCAGYGAGLVGGSLQSPAWLLARDAIQSLWPNRAIRVIVACSLTILILGYAGWQTLSSQQQPPNRTSRLRINHDGGIAACAFSKDAEQLWTLDIDGKMREWQVPQGTCLRERTISPKPLGIVDLNGDGSLACFSNKHGIWAYDLTKGETILELKSPARTRRHAVFLDTRTPILAVVDPGATQVALHTLTPLSQVETWECGWPIRCLASRGSTLAAASMDGHIAIREASGNTRAFNLDLGDAKIHSIAITDQGNIGLLLNRDRASAIESRNLQTLELVRRVSCDPLTHLFASGQDLLAGQFDDFVPKIFVLDCSTGRSGTVNLGPDALINVVAISRNGRIARLSADMKAVEIHGGLEDLPLTDVVDGTKKRE